MPDSTEQKFLLRQNPWYQAAVGSAIVSAVFVGVIAVLLAVQTYHLKGTDSRRTAKLEMLRRQYQSAPADEALAGEIRDFDARLRRDQFARLQFVKRGVVLLTASLAVLVGTLYWLGSFARRLPHPEPPGDLSPQQVARAMQTRTAVTLTLVIMGAAGLYMAMRTSEPPAAAPAAEEAAAAQEPAAPPPAFASWQQMQRNWPVFRGPEGAGICRFEKIPTEWDGPSGKNIRWKTAIPLPGHNSPIVWEDRIFLTGASEDSRQVYCFDADTGSLLWTGTVPISSSPDREDMYIMEDTGYAASTAAVNGAYVAAIFADGQVGCFDLEGRRQWVRSLGVPNSAYGYASSLAAWEDKLIIQFDQDYEPGRSKLMALDFAAGTTVWQTDRPVPNSWTTPTVVRLGDRMQILTSGSPWVIGYDPANGSELWRVECLGGDVAPTQIVAGGRVLVIEPYTKLAAVDPAAGQVLWEAGGSLPDICSPLSDGRLVWTLSSEGTLSGYDIIDGSRLYAEELDGFFMASPSLIGDMLMLVGMKGRTLWIRAGRAFEMISECELGEEIFASPAFHPGRIYLRGTNHLYCIESQP